MDSIVFLKKRNCLEKHNHYVSVSRVVVLLDMIGLVISQVEEVIIYLEETEQQEEQPI